MKNIVIGIAAHVDAGKTTLSEELLYQSGETDRVGRVDNGDTHLDTHSLERARGITIFSKMATFDAGDTHVTLIDTPGHVDFSCETERTLSVQDYCVLVISAPDGVRSHTRTLWRMLRARKIPTIIFVNKMDRSTRRQDEIMGEINAVLSPHAVNFSREGSDEFYEEVASCDEELIELFLNQGKLDTPPIVKAISQCKVFPCLFGAALKGRGVCDLLRFIEKYTCQPSYSDTIFGARIYKIARDPSGRRISYAKITGGSLSPKDTIELRTTRGELTEEKVEEIRVFSRDRSRPIKTALPGMVCALYGPQLTAAGMGIGIESDDTTTLTPVLDYRLILPEGVDSTEGFARISVLCEEDPALSLKHDSETSEIRVSLMGEIQLEVLSAVIEERFGYKVSFDEGRIRYRETVSEAVYGAGHFEPLRHYAEVHLRIEPLPEGSGVVADTECDRDYLSTNWQRLILTHIDERVHKGVLLGAPLTDVKITLVAGKAHLKHTEGGDFRQATYRAIRQGLRKARSVILEPTFDFRLELPREYLGRAMTDLGNMAASYDAPDMNESTAVLVGNCPVYTMRSYSSTVRAYTRGEGHLTLNVGAYKPCHNSEDVIAARGYDPDLDERNTASSVFCKAGAGYAVPWYESDSLMHLRPEESNDAPEEQKSVPIRARAKVYNGTAAEDKELMRIFEATYGKVKQRAVAEKKENAAPNKPSKPPKLKPRGDEYVLLDAYNVIFAWDDLRAAAMNDLSYGRDMLVRLMCNYSAFHKCKVIIVFDAYRVKDGKGSVEQYGNVTVVYTKEAETADTYIERATYKIAPENYVRVVTSDLEEQYIILGNGAFRVSAAEFKGEYEATALRIKDEIDKYKVKRK